MLETRSPSTALCAATNAPYGPYALDVGPERIAAYRLTACRLRWQTWCRLVRSAVAGAEALLAYAILPHPHDHGRPTALRH